MSRILVIAEKPSLGREIAQALAHMHNARIRSEGICQHVGDCTVIGAQGHLFQLASPEFYGEEFAFPWRIEPLPVLPEQLIIEPNFVKEKGKVVNNDLTKAIRTRLAAIKELIQSANTVVHAGDPDREGQLIIDDIIGHFGFRGTVKRLWLHAQTIDGIQAAWRTMKSNDAYGNLGLAAVARRESDWVIGMNATRAYTATWWKKGHKSVLNIGRVVTPLVGMIVQREHDIEDFVPTDHYTLRATIRIDGHLPYQAMWIKPSMAEGETRQEIASRFDSTGRLIIDQAYVEAFRTKCDGQPATITAAETRPKQEPPPLLFSLVELQKMAAKMGYPPDKTLEAAQSLYEKHKLTSYPRTGCQYAPESEHSKATDVLRTIINNFGGSWRLPAGWNAQRKSRAWDDSKLAEHFAIIPLPTPCSAGQLSRLEADVYKLICRQYFAQFFPNYEYLASTLIATVQGENFKATGRTPTKEGWRTLYGGTSAIKKPDDPESDEQQRLPAVHMNDTGQAQPVELLSNATKPPSRFTSVTLLEAMEKAHLHVMDPKVKAKLKAVGGIGTEATRAAIIAKAIATDLVGEDRSARIISYFPTPKAYGYVRCLPETITRPDLTVWFENKLEELANGSLKYPQYRKMLAKLVEHIIASAKDGTALERMPSPDSMPTPIVSGTKNEMSNKNLASGKGKSATNKNLRGDL